VNSPMPIEGKQRRVLRSGIFIGISFTSQNGSVSEEAAAVQRPARAERKGQAFLSRGSETPGEMSSFEFGARRLG